MLPADLAFHHVGVACRELDRELAHWIALGYAVEGPRFEDPLQGVRGVFLGGQQPRVELLAPLDPDRLGVLAPWLRSGSKLYHLGYEAPSLRRAIEALRGARGKLVMAPTPAVAFGGREIAFVMMPNGALIELIAREPA